VFTAPERNQQTRAAPGRKLRITVWQTHIWSKAIKKSGTQKHEIINMTNEHRSENHRSKPLSAGIAAPDFSLLSTPDQTVKLSEFHGRPVVLAFYPADWSPVCGDQMSLYNEMLSEFRDLGAEILGISVDGAWCHAAFCRDRKLHFPLLADFEPKGEVARRYGVYRQNEGVCERALFVIDAAGIIRWSYVSPVGVNPGAAGVLAALERMQTSRDAGA
jgi:peroxiredoxin